MRRGRIAGMLKYSIGIVGALGTIGLLIGILGEATFLTCGCILIGSALIAAAIALRSERYL
jgi:hypothetical protein